MATNDRFLGDAGDGRAGSLERIPRTPATDETARRPITDDPDGEPGVVELVDWMARRRDMRTVLQEHLRDPEPGARDGRQPMLPLLGDLLQRCRREVDERGLHPRTLDLRATVRAACEPVLADDGVDLAIRVDGDVPATVHLDGELLDHVLSLLASATTVQHPGHDVEVRVRCGEGEPVQDGRVAVLAVELRAEGAASAGRPGPSAGMRALARGICQELVALMGGSLASGTGPDGEPRYRFTVPVRRT